MVEFEDMFEDCASMCELPLFYLNKPISKGTPKQTCTQAYMKTIPENEQKRKALAVQSAITIACIFIALVAAFPNFVDVYF